MTFTNSRGIRHTVDVQADSLFEAAVLAIQILKKNDWVSEAIGGSTTLEVEVRDAVTKHTVTMLQIQRWLEGATPSPNDRVKKDRLRALLSAK